MVGDYSFALCLTHDVDRPYKRIFHKIYYGIKGPNKLYHFKSLFRRDNPYWQFEYIMKIESSLGVRSSFYFLNEKSLFRDKNIKEWIKPRNWVLYTGYYSINDLKISAIINKLDKNGWEVGLHGSFDSYNEPERMKYEKKALEKVLGHEVMGIRQHYLNLNIPETWEIQRRLGFKYDTSLGSSREVGFKYGYEPIFPSDDDFAIFPLTVMDVALMRNSPNIQSAWNIMQKLLEEAKKHNAVMTILWHVRVFSEPDFPGYGEIYKRTIEKALEMDAWVGPCGELYKYLGR